MEPDSSDTEPEENGSPHVQLDSEGLNAPMEEVPEEPEEVFREPVNDGREVSFLTKSINPYLQCGLCQGYLRDAHSIMECLHCFCYSCIVKYFYDSKNSHTCPSCGIHLGTEPILAIHPDHTLQNIVDKVFPEFARKEYELEKALNEARGIELPKAIMSPTVYATRTIPSGETGDEGPPSITLEAVQSEPRASSGAAPSAAVTTSTTTSTVTGTPKPQPADAGTEAASASGSASLVRVGVKRDGNAAAAPSPSPSAASSSATPSAASATARTDRPHKKAKRKHKASGQMITFKLFRDDAAAETEAKDASMGPLMRPTLKTSSSITVMHLKKFLAAKLQLESVAQVDVLCRGARLGNEYTLEYVKKTIWELHHEAGEDNQLVLTYRQKKLDHMHI